MNNELQKLNSWLSTNKLTLNIKKSNFVLFRPYQKKVSSKIDIRIFDNFQNNFVSLENKEYVKYPGLLMYCNLSWSFHINYISTKVSKSVGLIAKLGHFVPQETLITLYWALIHPYLNYGIAIWGQSSKSLFNKLFSLIKTSIEINFFKSNQQSAIPLFLKTKIPPLKIMYVQSLSTLIHAVINKNAPDT